MLKGWWIGVTKSIEIIIILHCYLKAMSGDVSSMRPRQLQELEEAEGMLSSILPMSK